MRQLISRLGWIRVISLFIAVALCIFALIMSIISDAQYKARLAQYDQQATQTQDTLKNAVVSKYGDAPLRLCRSLSAATANSPTMASTEQAAGNLPNGRFVAILMPDETIYQDYDQALPAANKAQSQADLSGVICIQKNTDIIYAKDPYEPLNGASDATPTHFCNHHRTDLDVTVIDAKTGQVIKMRQFTGLLQDEFPCLSINNFDTDWDALGKPAEPSQVIGWLLGSGS